MKMKLDGLLELVPPLSRGEFVPYSPLLVISKGRPNVPMDRIVDELERNARDTRVNVHRSIDNMHKFLIKKYPQVLVPPELLEELFIEDMSSPKFGSHGSTHHPVDIDKVESVAMDHVSKHETAGASAELTGDPFLNNPIDSTLWDERPSNTEEICQTVALTQIFGSLSKHFICKTSGVLNNDLEIIPLNDQTAFINSTNRKRVYERPPDPAFLSSNSSFAVDPWLIPRFAMANTSDASKPIHLSFQKATIKQLLFSGRFLTLGLRSDMRIYMFRLPPTVLSWNSPKYWFDKCEVDLSLLNDFLDKHLASTASFILKMRLSPHCKNGIAVLLSSSLIIWNGEALAIHIIDLGHLLPTTNEIIDFEYSSIDDKSFVFMSSWCIFILNSDECRLLFDLNSFSNTGASRCLESFCLLKQHPTMLNMYCAVDPKYLFVFDLSDLDCTSSIIPRLRWQYQFLPSRTITAITFFSMPQERPIHGIIGWNERSKEILVFIFQIGEIASATIYQSLNIAPFIFHSVNQFSGFRNDFQRDSSYLPMFLESPKRNSYLVDVFSLTSFDCCEGDFFLSVFQAYSDEEIYVCSYRFEFPDLKNHAIFGMSKVQWSQYLERFNRKDELFLPFTYERTGKLAKIGYSPWDYRLPGRIIDLTVFFKFMTARMFFEPFLIEDEASISNLLSFILRENEAIISSFVCCGDVSSLSFENIRRILVNRLLKPTLEPPPSKGISYSLLLYAIDVSWREIVKTWRERARVDGFSVSEPNTDHSRFFRNIHPFNYPPLSDTVPTSGPISIHTLRKKILTQLQLSSMDVFSVLENCSIEHLSLPTLAFISDSLKYSSVLIQKDTMTVPLLAKNELVQSLCSKWDDQREEFQSTPNTSSVPRALDIGFSSSIPRIQASTHTGQPEVSFSSHMQTPSCTQASLSSQILSQPSSQSSSQPSKKTRKGGF